MTPILIVSLALSAWTVTVRADDGTVTDSYYTRNRPRLVGVHLCLDMRIEPGPFRPASTREVCVPAAHATVAEVREPRRPLTARSRRD